MTNADGALDEMAAYIATCAMLTGEPISKRAHWGSVAVAAAQWVPVALSTNLFARVVTLDEDD